MWAKISCADKTYKGMAKRNIGQFKHILGPSFGRQDILISYIDF